MQVAYGKTKKIKGEEHIKPTKVNKGEFLSVSCYDEEPQHEVNYIYAKINGFDEYVTLQVKNTFSVYKMPKFKIIVPEDGFILEPIN